MTSWVCGSAALLLIGGACSSRSDVRRQLGAPNPLDRAVAAVEVAEERDPQAVHRLVDLLEDSSAAVRMYAILALERLTGSDYGYEYYADPAERAAAVNRWREALRAGAVAVRKAEAG